MIPLLLLMQIAQSDLDRLVRGVVESGRVMEIGVEASERVAPVSQIAPGPPPVLAFRFLDGNDSGISTWY